MFASLSLSLNFKHEFGVVQTQTGQNNTFLRLNQHRKGEGGAVSKQSFSDSILGLHWNIPQRLSSKGRKKRLLIDSKKMLFYKEFKD